MFKYQTTAWRVVNRKGLSIKADANGIIQTDDKEIADIFLAMWFINLEKEEVKAPVTKKKNAKV